MILGGDNTRLENIIAACDAFAVPGTRTRRAVEQLSSLSRPTVLRAIEALLDTGLINEQYRDGRYSYRMNPACLYAIADLRGGFRMSYADGTGRVLHSYTFRELDAFFYDEKLSVFLRSGSLEVKKLFPKYRLIGVCVILPSSDTEHRNTKSILSSSDRLSALLDSYCSCKCRVILRASDSAEYMLQGRRALLVLKEGAEIYARAIGYGCTSGCLLKTVGRTRLGRCPTGAALAAELAFALGNICTLLSPDELYLDGGELFSFSAFPRLFKEALAAYCCIDESELPQIHHSDGSLVIRGAVRRLRCDYIEKMYN